MTPRKAAPWRFQLSHDAWLAAKLISILIGGKLRMESQTRRKISDPKIPVERTVFLCKEMV